MEGNDMAKGKKGTKLAAAKKLEKKQTLRGSRYQY